MECIDTENSKRLNKFIKVFFPLLILFTFVFYQFHRYSIDTIEIFVVSKHAEWIEHCTEKGCVEALMFTVKSKDEYFTTSEALFDQLEPKNSYLVGTKGWSSFGTNRNLTQVH